MILPKRLQNLFPVMGLHFSRPLVLFQSDDWGFVGIRGQEEFEEFRRNGLPLGSHPYDFYSLETAEDLHSLYEVLLRHRDSIGRPPCFVFNFIVANVDFPEVIDSGFTRLKLLPLEEGFPGRWDRPGLIRAYLEGIESGVVYPAFHGLTHFCQGIVEDVMKAKGGRGKLLQTLYEADTPLIPRLTPWLDFEYRKESGWLDGTIQRKLIQQGKQIYEHVFERTPVSACAPGYRANDDTWRAWAEEGMLVGQNGPGLPLAPFFGKEGLLHLYRNVPFEPALDPNRYDEYDAMKKAERALTSSRPIIVCMHSINFHSALKNYRDTTLNRLDRFLTMLENRYKDLLYVHDYDLWQIAKRGELEWNRQKIAIRIMKQLQPSPGLQSHCTKVSPESAGPVQEEIRSC